jgi:pseudomonalisin
MSRTRLLSLVAVGCLIAAPAVEAVATTGGTSSWVATHTGGRQLAAPDLGAAPAGRTLQISVGLAVRNKAAMNQLATAVATPGNPAYHHFLTPAQVAARFGPTTTTTAAVVGYLRANGFRAVTVEPDRLLVDAIATVGQAERAFHTRIDLFRWQGRVVYANVDAAEVPATLGHAVVSVLGLSDIPMTFPISLHHGAPAKLPVKTAGSPDTSGFTEAALLHAYDGNTLPAATRTTIAVLTSGNMTPTIAALRWAEKELKYPQAPVQIEYAGPEQAITSDNPLTGNLEWDLDTQMSTMMAGNVKKLYIYDVGTYTDPEVARGINMFVEQDRALSMSVSLGECDFVAFLDGAMITTDEALEEGALQGQSMFAATGDNGFACPYVASTGVPGGVPGDSWPGDGEWTTACGGTTLLADSAGNRIEEIAWIGGGGGISPWETAEPWTLRANIAGQTWEWTNQGGRSVPDVAADADANVSPVLIYPSAKSSPIGVGGTSTDGPLIMGLWSRIQNVHRDALGDAQYDFYRLYNKVNQGTVVVSPIGTFTYIPSPNPQPVKGFNDITAGTNGLFFAYPGYDYTTGIGTLQAAVLSKQL